MLNHSGTIGKNNNFPLDLPNKPSIISHVTQKKTNMKTNETKNLADNIPTPLPNITDAAVWF